MSQVTAAGLITQRWTAPTDDEGDGHAVGLVDDDGHGEGHPPGVVLRAVWRRSGAAHEGRAVARQLAFIVMAAGAIVRQDAIPVGQEGDPRSDVDVERRDEAA